MAIRYLTRPSPKRKDLTGKRFGRYTALEYVGDSKWSCRCDCGNVRVVQSRHIVGGHSKSCGCLKAELSSKKLSAKFEAGQKFGRLTVIRRSGSQRYSAQWLCKCDCGNEKVASSFKLSSGYTTSCGCAFLDAIKTHGKSRTRTYTIWSHMRQRCSNQNADTWENYGGRGITCCERWDKFENFFADMGEAPAGHSLDRIDCNGNYEPNNCRWATRKVQANNTRRNKIVSVNGGEMSLTDAIALLRKMARRKVWEV